MRAYDVAIVGAGFVGSALATHLSRDYEVVTFDVKAAPPLLKGFHVEHRTCDITRFDEVREKLGKPKVVIHTAIIQIPAINEFRERAFAVNVLGTQNVCRLVKETSETAGLILTGSWHVFGEREYGGVIDVAFGYRPDKVEERAKLYVVSKMLQEGIVRFYDAMVGEKAFNILRLGTVLGAHMPAKSAANIFVTNGLQGKPITPYKHSMHRPMLYVAIEDVCQAFHSRVETIVNGETGKAASARHVFNLFYPEPITIVELAELIREAVILHTDGRITPELKVVDKGLPGLFDPENKHSMRTDVSDLNSLLNVSNMASPKAAIFAIVKGRCEAAQIDRETRGSAC